MTFSPSTRRRLLASGASFLTLGCVSVDDMGSMDPSDDDAETDDDTGIDDGAADESGDPAVQIHNPYEAVSWDEVEHHKCEFHNHPAKMEDPRREEPHHMVDLYHGSGEDSEGNVLADGDGYTVYSVSDMGIYSETRWPWTELSEIRGGEDRDPEELGVISFPGSEIRSGPEHVSFIFSTATDDEHTTEDRLEAIQQVLESDMDEPKTLAVIAHPRRYYENPAEEWTRYEPDFSELSLQDGLVGFEILNKASSTRRFGRHEDLLPDLDLWDHLLSEFMPERPIWGYGTDDANEFIIGRDVDVRWTELLLQPDEFDPSAQEASRQAAMEAMLDGRVFGVERARWDHNEEEPPQPPRIQEIAVDGATIALSASEYETIRWISNGQVVGSEDAISLAPEHAPYVRAELWGTNDESITITQPFGISEAD